MARNAAASGMINIGKTNLTEYAFSGIGLNPHWGTPVNPFGTRTSERASPVAPPPAPQSPSPAGLVPAASRNGHRRVRTDSRHVFNGLAGLKTSEGRISLKGVAPLAPTFDTAGPICRTVEDCVACRRSPCGACLRRLPRSRTRWLGHGLPRARIILHRSNLEGGGSRELRKRRSSVLAEFAGAEVRVRRCAEFLDAYNDVFVRPFLSHRVRGLTRQWRHVLARATRRAHGCAGQGHE